MRCGNERTSLIASHVIEHPGAATANLTLAALRGVLRECRRLGLMSADDHARAVDLPHATGKRLPAFW
jgi:hypothetical protein